MGNKITLTYENGEFNVALNENVVYTDKEMEGALLKFNAVVKIMLLNKVILGVISKILLKLSIYLI